MSEDDRQVKAARAKAMLKKRQQKAASKPGVSSSSPPPSRTFTPIPSDVPPSSSPIAQTEGYNNSVGDIFGKGTESKDGSWMNSLTRAETPPPSYQTPDALLLSPSSRTTSTSVNSPGSNFAQNVNSELHQQHNAVPLLESEKNSLVTEFEGSRETGDSLQHERVKIKAHSNNIQHRDEHLRASPKKVDEQHENIPGLQADSNGFLQSQKSQRDPEIIKHQLEGRLREEMSRNSDLNTKIEQLEASVQNTSAKMAQYQQTISLLVSEKTTLTASLERLEQLEPRAQELEELLHTERTRSSSLEINVKQLEATLAESSTRVAYLSAQEKGLQDRCREQERELQLINGSLNDLQAESDRYQRKAQELEERIQSDDRVEKLEGVLQNTRDRADELDFQLSKVKQAHTALKAEHDDVQSHLRTMTDTGCALEKKYAETEKRLSSAQGELSSVLSERDSLLQNNSSITSRAEADRKALADLQDKLSQAAAEFASNSRQLQSMQSELKKANRRVEDAEKMQSDLQAEGMTLMRSLEEMRPKIVELTNIRLELVDKIEGLEGVIRKKEDAITFLESSLEEARERAVEAEKSRQREHALRRKDESTSQDNLSQTHKAYGELQAELEALKINLRDREAEREGYHQLALRRLEEVDRLTFSFQAQTERLTSAEKELDERRVAQTEDQGFVEGMQNEIEALRHELALREEEFGRLREPSSDLAQSLDGEMVSALKQQQTLELSNARSQIRALESAVFESDARAHSLQKQVSTLMDQLTQLRSLSNVPSRPFSPTPGLPSRPSSRARGVSDELRRASMNASRRPAAPPPPQSSPSPSARRAFDSLSPETRHKRRVSLGMLKARIDSEVASSVKPHPPSRALTPLQESSDVGSHGSITGSVMEPSEPHHIRGFRRHQFLDESHIFWCNSCHGDLVIL